MPMAPDRHKNSVALAPCIFVDFDGTIAPGEPTDALFDRFADPRWREIEREWHEGRLSSRACMARQVEMLRATPEQVENFLGSVAIDPDFPDFVAFCRRVGFRLVVVSDGLDRVVAAALARTGLDLPFYANRLDYLGGERWALHFPHQRSSCAAEMGNCKCGHARFAQERINILVGDGRSDFCLAERCNLVLAKGKLAEHCSEKQIPHRPIRNFLDARIALAHWLVIGRGVNHMTAAPTMS